MFENFKNMSGGFKTVLIMGTLILVAFVGTFLGFYHRPITLQDEETKTAIMEMISEDVSIDKVSNLRVEEAIFEDCIDTIYTISPEKFKNKNDIWYWSRVAIYDVQVDSASTMTYATVFEIDEVFLKKLVGKKLFTVKNIVEVTN